MHCSSRRSFLTTSSLALAGLAIGRSSLARALPMRATQPVTLFLPDIVDSTTLRRLAAAGLDAVRQRDVTYADIRVANAKQLSVWWDASADVPLGEVQLNYTFGVRVRVGGTWGFAYGTTASVDAVAQAAQSALATARGLARVSATPTELAPVPVATGEWQTPMQIDPFDVSPDDHSKVLGAFAESVERVLGGGLDHLMLQWNDETRVFASSEGAMLTQRLMTMLPTTEILGHHLNQSAALSAVGLNAGSVGFECVTGPQIQERFKAAAEEAVQLASYPQGAVDVGRYEAVVDGTTLGAMLLRTIAPALEMERVLGYEADGVGTSFLAPARDTLGQPLFSPLLTMHANRTAPYLGAARWDDEGVVNVPFPLIEHGRVVNYFTSRETAHAIAERSTSHGTTVPLYGSAISSTPAVAPTGMAAQLVVETGETGISLEELVRSVKNGVLVRNADHIFSDPQLMNGTFTPKLLYEIKNGRITRRLMNGMAQFGTKGFLKSIDRLGDASTVEGPCVFSARGDMLVRSWTAARVPAAHLQQLDLVQATRGV